MSNTTTTTRAYSVGHTNIDGYGHVSDHRTLAEAVAEAERLQALAAEHGNPWRYRHHVGHRGRIVHRTNPTPAR